MVLSRSSVQIARVHLVAYTYRDTPGYAAAAAATSCRRDMPVLDASAGIIHNSDLRMRLELASPFSRTVHKDELFDKLVGQGSGIACRFCG